MPRERMTKAATMRVEEALRACGWVPTGQRKRLNGVQRMTWVSREEAYAEAQEAVLSAKPAS